MPRMTYQTQTEAAGPVRTPQLSGADFGAGAGTGVIESMARQESEASERLGNALQKVSNTLLEVEAQHKKAERAAALTRSKALAASELQEYGAYLNNGKDLGNGQAAEDSAAEPRLACVAWNSARVS